MAGRKRSVSEGLIVIPVPARQFAPNLLPGWLLALAAALTLYTLTANRGVQWQDSGVHILRVLDGEVLNPRGLALSHPLHHYLGRTVVALNLAEPAFVITLLSALAGALAVANVYGCARTLGCGHIASGYAAASLALANTFWHMSTLTETYTLSAALLSAECWFLAAYGRSTRARFLAGALFCNGLGVANHLLAMLTTPILLVVLGLAWRARRVRRPEVVVCAALWVLGAAPYIVLVAQEWLRTGDALGTLHSAFFGHRYAEAVLNVSLSPRLLGITAGFALLSFPSLLIPLAVYGLSWSRRAPVSPLVRRALAVGLLIHVVFVFRYDVVDRHLFLVPAYIVLALFGALGVERCRQTMDSARRRLVLGVAVAALALTPGVYALVPFAARRLGVLGDLEHRKPYRDDYVYLFQPWAVVETSADRMGREAVAMAGDTGLIHVEDGMASAAVRYHQIRSGRPGLAISHNGRQDELSAAVHAGRTVVLVPADVANPRTPPPVGIWERTGDLYRLRMPE